jgi:predicted nucleotidyltransferase
LAVISHPDTVAEITQRLIGFFNPERIYLFGSEARGDAGPDSDLDFIVVVADEAPAALLSGAGHAAMLKGIAAAVDVIPWRKSDFEGRAAHVATSLPATVVREGRLLYDAGRMAA